METTTTDMYPDLETWRKSRDEGRGWTLQQAADFLGISQTTYRNIERGFSSPRASTAQQIIEKTGVPLKSLSGAA